MLFPLGIQTFEELRRGNYCYVDKTAFVHKMVAEGKFYFLSRPRRFGKSLLISTLQAYFEGKKELFSGLAIEQKETEWRQYPVLHVDLTGTSPLADILDDHLATWEKQYNVPVATNKPIGLRFKHVIEHIAISTNTQVVILVDEYDKPLLETVGHPKKQDANRELLKEFYFNLKTQERYIKFALLTGVSKFSQISIFSGLNSLNDISLWDEYSAVCGITEPEMLHTFHEPIQALANKKNISFDEALTKLRAHYDGYHFASNCEGVYNPFSLMNALMKREFGKYWYATGTPTFLTRVLEQTSFNIASLDGQIEADAEQLMTFDEQEPLSVLFQAGYLTIKRYDENRDKYTLAFPNDEVRIGFTRSLAKSFFAKTTNAFDINLFSNDLADGNIDNFMRRLTALFADFDYRLIANAEVHFQSSVYLICTLLGYNSQVERATSNGRMDYVLFTDKYIYIFEFKINASPEQALQQIEEKGYARPFTNDPRQLIRVGVNFSTDTRSLQSYKVANNNS